MKKIKFFPAPHVELRVHVSDEMIADYKNCEELFKVFDGKDCDTCSWNNVEIEGTRLCEYPEVQRQVLEDENE